MVFFLKVFRDLSLVFCWLIPPHDFKSPSLNDCVPLNDNESGTLIRSQPWFFLSILRVCFGYQKDRTFPLHIPLVSDIFLTSFKVCPLSVSLPRGSRRIFDETETGWGFGTYEPRPTFVWSMYIFLSCTLTGKCSVPKVRLSYVDWWMILFL